MEFEKLGKAIWRMKKEPPMKVDALIVGVEEVIRSLKKDKTLSQLRNVSSLPGIFRNSVLMPDAHEGYGFPIGGVAAFEKENGIVSPGGVGYDINCGVRLIKTPLFASEINLKELVDALYKSVPSGVGSESGIRLSKEELDEVGEKGIDWAIENGFALKEDKERIEEYGRVKGDPSKVSKKAKERGRFQLGTLGSGNHFLEVQVVEKVFSPIANEFGLQKGQIVIMIHCGSRGYGHQIASDYIREFLPIAKRLNLFLPDLELVYLPLYREEAQSYLSAMNSAINFAFTNRQIITYFVREVFDKLYSISKEEMPLLYDVAHNIAKFEKHVFEGEEFDLIIHRKGATRAFPPNHKDLPNIFKELGQPVLIPGSMGTSSYVLVGKEKGLEISFGSSCHGAGRRMSRRKARETWRAESLLKQLLDKGIYVRSKTLRGVTEEAPQAYKDVDVVVRSVELAGISDVVAKLKPVGVVKG